MTDPQTPVEALEIEATLREEIAIETLGQALGDVATRRFRADNAPIAEKLELDRQHGKLLDLRARFYRGEASAVSILNDKDENDVTFFLRQAYDEAFHQKSACHFSLELMDQETHDVLLQSLKDDYFYLRSGGDKNLQKTIAVVGGQPSAGKTHLLRHVENEISNKSTMPVILNPDELRARIPDFMRQYLQFGPLWFATTHEPLLHHWRDELLAYARERRVNAVFETTMRNPLNTTALMRAFKNEGYRTEAHMMATPELVSLVGLFLRNETLRTEKKMGRWPPVTLHNEAYVEIPKTLSLLQNAEGLCDRIALYGRDHQVIFDTDKPALSPFTDAAAALYAERERPWSDAAKEEYLGAWKKVKVMVDARFNGNKNLGGSYMALIHALTREAENLRDSQHATAGRYYQGVISDITPHFVFQHTEEGFVHHPRKAFDAATLPKIGDRRPLAGISPILYRKTPTYTHLAKG